MSLETAVRSRARYRVVLVIGLALGATPAAVRRLGIEPEDLRKIPLDRLGWVELSDGQYENMEDPLDEVINRRKLTYLAKDDYFKSWKTSWFFKSVGQISCEREGGEKSQQSLQIALEVCSGFDRQISENARRMMDQGKQIFRYDTFGDEIYWTDKLKLHHAIQGTKFGGVGAGVSPKTALAVGLKVDMDALPQTLVNQIKQGKVNLDDPATTLALIKLDAVLGVKGTFNPNGSLKAVGLTCAVCHSTVDDAFAPGIGHRLDGWSNQDLNVGAIVSPAPDLSALTSLLGVDEATVKTVLASWGPGKFDAELILDGKAFNPQQVTNGVVTGTNVPGATLIPNAFGLAGYNEHTWTGSWGTGCCAGAPGCPGACSRPGTGRSREQCPRPQRQVQAFDFTCDAEGRITVANTAAAGLSSSPSATARRSG